MRDYAKELKDRTEFIKAIVKSAGAEGVIYGNSGGKDSALVSILCKKAGIKTIGVIMPCASSRNFGEDMDDAKAAAEQYGIETLTIDLTKARETLAGELSKQSALSRAAIANIAPRLRMITLYTLAQSKGLLVAGTGNRSELYMGYFTKWGDGACDFNPISDLTVREVYEFLEFLGAPENIIKKAPSAGLYEGQTDEAEMGITYQAIDSFLLNGEASEADKEKLLNAHKRTAHKRRMPVFYGEDGN